MNTTPNTPGGPSRSSDTDTAKAAAADVGNEATAKAKELGQGVADRAREQADAAKAGAAEEISSVSRALRRASEELREGSPQERTFGAAADAMADFADSVRDRDLGQMVDELSDFARRNPVGFLGGAALLGFAGVRLAKASRRARYGDDTADLQGGAGHPTGTGATTGATPGVGGATTTSPAAGAGSTPATPGGGTSTTPTGDRP